jgi:lipoic acid synthetase
MSTLENTTISESSDKKKQREAAKREKFKSTYIRKPEWLKRPIPGGTVYSDVYQVVKEKKLHTVCESASCPNLGECWDRGTATFMILGNMCTRGCRFCDVPKGKPSEYDRAEPMRVAASVQEMKLKYAVITSVNRDDLQDQGSEVWGETIRQVRTMSPNCYVEVLIPDFQGDTRLLDVVLEAKPHVLNHNLETVKRLQEPVRGRANLEDSSKVLRYSKERGFMTKTSFMLGMGETQAEVEDMVLHCAELQVDIITFGQYLMPSKSHYPLAEYVTPEQFTYYKNFALENGIRICESSPMQRSSYKAERAIDWIERYYK